MNHCCFFLYICSTTFKSQQTIKSESHFGISGLVLERLQYVNDADTTYIPKVTKTIKEIEKCEEHSRLVFYAFYLSVFRWPDLHKPAR